MMTKKIDLGPCCACGKTDQSCRNIIMLPKKAKNSEGGWGCVVCGVWGGAVVVLCDYCFENGAKLIMACDGYPKDGNRIPIDDLKEPFDHDLSKHSELDGYWVRE